MKFKYKEYDLPNKKLQEELSKLTLEELEELSRKGLEIMKQQPPYDYEKEHADKERGHGE